jgi:hypothetical protein
MVVNSTQYVQSVKELSNQDGIVSFIIKYLIDLPHNALQGDYFSILVFLILGYFIIIVVNKISGLFMVVLKKTIAFLVVVLALLMTYSKFTDSLLTEGYSLNTVIIGVGGILIAVFGSIISFYGLFRHAKNAVSGTKLAEAEIKEQRPGIDINQIKDFKTFFSLDSLKNDKSLLSVLTFLIVAEFGVFSSRTISAPNPKIGMIIFAIFITLSFLFIRQSYRDYSKGLTHIILTFVFGSVLALILGHYWEGLPFSVLLSLEIFATDALVALISGMALSLFAGSKG